MVQFLFVTVVSKHFNFRTSSKKQPTVYLYVCDYVLRSDEDTQTSRLLTDNDQLTSGLQNSIYGTHKNTASET
jgi:hypothetical protein